MPYVFVENSYQFCNSFWKLNRSWIVFSLASRMTTSLIKPSRLPKMGCCHVQSCPPPQKWKRKGVPRPRMIPFLRVGGRGVPPWHPKPGSSRSTSSYSSRRWRSGLRNGPTRKDHGPASNSLIRFSGKAKVSTAFAPCFLVYCRNEKVWWYDCTLWENQRFMMFFLILMSVLDTQLILFLILQIKGRNAPDNYNYISVTFLWSKTSLWWGENVCLRIHCSCL